MTSMTYNEAALNERNGPKWLHKFEIDDDKEPNGRPKVYEGPELEALLKEYSYPTKNLHKQFLSV